MIVIDKPRDSDVHSLADYAELLCLLTYDRLCSRETISDQIKDVGDSKVTDNALEDCFAHLEWRKNAFGAHYPFAIDEGRFLSAEEEVTSPQKLYILLLLCSNLPYFKRLDGSLTNAFERVSLIAMKGIFPSSSEIRPFGKCETNYTGTKADRLNRLAQDIGGFGSCDSKTFRERDTGDGGVDLVSWVPLDPYERRNIPSALAQCACSRNDWASKQTEISHTRLGGYLHPSVPWMELLFMPHSFRDNHGNWAVRGDVGMTIILDRLRIINQVGEDISWNDIDPPKILDDFLEERLSLV